MKYCGEYLNRISFPVGGIGTGCIGLGGDGRLVDWEIFNRPSKGSINGYSHMAVRAIDGDRIIPRILNGDMTKDYIGKYKQSKFTGFGYGPEKESMCGYQHFRHTEFDGRFPVASVLFSDDEFPGKIKLTAFNPFIPCDSANSSIPAAFFELEVTNTSDRKMEYQFAFSVTNPYDKSQNYAFFKDNFKAITLRNAGAEPDDVKYGDLTLITDCPDSYTQVCWYRGGWQDGVVSYWNNFSQDADWKDRNYDSVGEHDTATLLASVKVCPGECGKARFVLSWNVPNNFNDWCRAVVDDGEEPKKWKNYYSTVFDSSADSAVYSLSNFDSLFSRTLRFRDILHSSSLPPVVIDAVSSNLSVLKSPIVWRLEDGSFYGWEGAHERSGSCEGTCQHVWNYAYAMCFLFPDLERSIRDLEFKYSTDSDGKMKFRMTLPPGSPGWEVRACLDGQMGSVIKWYREWKLSGDDEWLRNNWDKIKSIVEYAWNDQNPDRWDYDKDGVLEGRQHHTLDMELFGPSSWLESMYLAALKAASQMARYLGDVSKADEYCALYENGRKWMKENLFNGRYFIHKVDIKDKLTPEKFDACDEYWNYETNEIKYQVGEGSAIDQMLGQWHSEILGLGDIFDKEQMHTALSEMMKNNFKPAMRDFTNPWRVFALNDEAGTVMCDYPEGSRKPSIPVPYSEEVMTGFEYAFAGLLCSQKMYDEGLRVVEAIRDRYDGKKRNPWNEVECGSNYARSMASFSLLVILSGFEFDMPHSHLGFRPYTDGDFRCFWSVEGAWGEFEISGNNAGLRIEEGSVRLASFGLNCAEKVESVKIDGSEVCFECDGQKILFEEKAVSQSIDFVMK